MAYSKAKLEMNTSRGSCWNLVSSISGGSCSEFVTTSKYLCGPSTKKRIRTFPQDGALSFAHPLTQDGKGPKLSPLAMFRRFLAGCRLIEQPGDALAR